MTGTWKGTRSLNRRDDFDAPGAITAKDVSARRCLSQMSRRCRLANWLPEPNARA